MATFIDTIKSKLGVPGRRRYETSENPPAFSGMSLKEKLQRLIFDCRFVNRNIRQRHQQVWYISGLYYSGYQSIELNGSGTALDVYERDDYYVENQYRKHVDSVKQILNQLEGDIVVRPGSDSPRDIATARVADPVLQLMRDTVCYDRIKDQKNLYKCLFGNAFIFSDYIVDKKYGTVVTPKFSYEQRPLTDDIVEDGADLGMGNPMQQPGLPPQDMVLSKVVSGYETRNRGQEVATVCSPLEINVLSDLKGGLDALPFLQWIGRQDADIINYLYPGLNEGASSAITEDLSAQYLEILGNIPGNILGDGLILNRGTSSPTKVELVRSWLTPATFRNDKELLREFPDGVHVTTVNGRVVDWYAEKLIDRWTHEVMIPLPHSMLGDGLYDAILMQDQINEANSLILKHVRYSTVGHNVYDATVIDPKDVINDPANGWIPGRPSLDKNIQQAVAQVQPNALSSDVAMWIQSRLTAMQDMTSAYDPVTGKGLGANTPYSQSVFLAERASSRWQGSQSFNRPELIRFHRQLLEIARSNWHDIRTRSVKDNTGNWSFQQFQQSDLQGQVDIILSNTDFKPRTRAEQIQGLTTLLQLAPILPGMPPRQKLRIEEMLGLPPDANPMSNQISRAYRQIDRIKKGEVVSPAPLVDDAQIQLPVFQDFLVSEEGEAVAEENPEVWAAVHTYMLTLMQMGMMQMLSPVGQMGMLGGGQQQPPEKQGSPAGGPPKPPGGQPGQPGGGREGGPGAPQQPPAQSPAQPAAPVEPPVQS